MFKLLLCAEYVAFVNKNSFIRLWYKNVVVVNQTSRCITCSD